MTEQPPQPSTDSQTVAPILPASTEFIVPTPAGGAEGDTGRWWRNTALAGLSVSLFVHTLLLLALALLWLDRPTGGDAGAGDEIQFAVMARSELTDSIAATLSAERQIIEDQVAAQIIQTQDLRASLPDIGAEAMDADLLASLTGAGSGQSDGSVDSLLSAGDQARFFGIEARGSRFAYVIDVSGSMEGERMVAMKTALIASIENLTDESRFAVILYSDRAAALTGDGWVRSGDASRSTSRQRIGAITAGGGTNPAPAFDLAQTLKPPPDAIYFMTDGEFTPDAEALLLSTVTQLIRASDAPIPIHGITFVSRGAEKLMRRLATMSRGTYTHVEGPRR